MFCGGAQEDFGKGVFPSKLRRRKKGDLNLPTPPKGGVKGVKNQIWKFALFLGQKLKKEFHLLRDGPQRGKALFGASIRGRRRK